MLSGTAPFFILLSLSLSNTCADILSEQDVKAFRVNPANLSLINQRKADILSEQDVKAFRVNPANLSLINQRKKDLETPYDSVAIIDICREAITRGNVNIQFYLNMIQTITSGNGGFVIKKIDMTQKEQHAMKNSLIAMGEIIGKTRRQYFVTQAYKHPNNADFINHLKTSDDLVNKGTLTSSNSQPYSLIFDDVKTVLDKIPDVPRRESFRQNILDTYYYFYSDPLNIIVYQNFPEALLAFREQNTDFVTLALNIASISNPKEFSQAIAAIKAAEEPLNKYYTSLVWKFFPKPSSAKIRTQVFTDLKKATDKQQILDVYYKISVPLSTITDDTFYKAACQNIESAHTSKSKTDTAQIWHDIYYQYIKAFSAIEDKQVVNFILNDIKNTILTNKVKTTQTWLEIYYGLVREIHNKAIFYMILNSLQNSNPEDKTKLAHEWLTIYHRFLLMIQDQNLLAVIINDINKMDLGKKIPTILAWEKITPDILTKTNQSNRKKILDSLYSQPLHKKLNQPQQWLADALTTK